MSPQPFSFWEVAATWREKIIELHKGKKEKEKEEEAALNSKSTERKMRYLLTSNQNQIRLDLQHQMFAAKYDLPWDFEVWYSLLLTMVGIKHCPLMSPWKLLEYYCLVMELVVAQCTETII